VERAARELIAGHTRQTYSDLHSLRHLQRRLFKGQTNYRREQFVATMERGLQQAAQVQQQHPNRIDTLETPTAARARLLSQEGKGMAFLTADPGGGNGLTTIPPMAFSLALQRSVGIVRSYGLDRNGRQLTCPAPSHRHQPANSHHAAICNLTGAQVIRHTVLVHGVTAMLRQVGITRVIRESSRAFTGPLYRQRASGHPLRIDIEVEPGAFSGMQHQQDRIPDSLGDVERGMLIDPTIRNPQTAGHLRAGSHRNPGVAAAAGETEKHEKYSGMFNPVTHTLIAFSVEVFGRLGKDAENFLQLLSLRATRDMQLEAQVNQVRASIMASLRRQLSCVLVKGLYQAELHYVGKTRAREQRDQILPMQYDVDARGVTYGGWMGGNDDYGGRGG
jgi:hypothetical protein